MRFLRTCSVLNRNVIPLCMCFLVFGMAGCASGNSGDTTITVGFSDTLLETKFYREISHSVVRLPVLLLFSGGSGPEAYMTLANKYADSGYDVVLLDGVQYRPQATGSVDGLRRTITRAQQSPHSLPGKVFVVGFSDGGSVALGLASSQSDLVAQVVTYYPNPSWIIDKETVVRNLNVPTLVFAGDADNCCGRTICCNIATIRAMASLAKDEGKPLDLVVYQGANHAFNFSDAPNFNQDATVDAFQRMLGVLRREPKT